MEEAVSNKNTEDTNLEVREWGNNVAVLYNSKECWVQYSESDVVDATEMR